MPVNNNLPEHPLLVNLKTNEVPKTNYINGLEAVNVRMLDCPTDKDLMKYIPEFASGTWEDYPKTNFTPEERAQVIDDLFAGYILPTALETIKMTFIVEGIDLVDVCHLIRHRTLSFSAQGTGDRDLRHDDVLVKPSILADSEYFERFAQLMEDAKSLYADITDDPDMPILDARTLMPRCTSNYYYVSGDLKAIMAFVGQRKDESIEPETVNIFAIKLWTEVVKRFPQLYSKIDLRSPDYFAIETSKGGRSSNFYKPEPKNDIYEYRLDWFMRDKMRQEMKGGHEYIALRDALLAKFDMLNPENDKS
jgi:hypothetical protein